MSRLIKHLECGCQPFLGIAIRSASRGQPINPSFFRVAIEKRCQVRAANKSLKIGKRTHCPKIRLPLLAALPVKNAPDKAPHFGGKLSDGINFPTAIKIPTIIPVGRECFEVQQIMTNLMENGIWVLASGFAGVNQDAFFWDEKLSKLVVGQGVNILHLEMKLLGQRPQ